MAPPTADPPPQSPHRLMRHAAIVCVCVWASAALVYPPITKYPLFERGLGGEHGDTGQYVRMEEGAPLRDILIPFRYRVFTPMLARLVPPVPHALLRYFEVTPDKLVKYRFGIVNLLGLAVTGTLLVSLCEAFGFSTAQGLLGALLFYTAFPVVNYAGAPMVEAWAWGFLVLGMLAAVRRWAGRLAFAMLAGMFAKETTLLLVPVVLLLAGTAREKLRQLAALAPGLVAYALFRWVGFPGGAGFSSDPGMALANLTERLQHGPYLAWIAFEGFTAFGLLLPLALLGARQLRGAGSTPLARLTWLVPAILVVPFVNAVGIGSGIGRIWFYAFPVVIPLALLGIERAIAAPRDPAGTTTPRA